MPWAPTAAKAFVEISAADEADSLGHHEWLGLLLDREVSWRRDKRLKARLRIAKLRHQASVEDVDYRSPLARHPTVRTDWIEPRGYGVTETFTIVVGYPASTPPERIGESYGHALPGNAEPVRGRNWRASMPLSTPSTTVMPMVRARIILLQSSRPRRPSTCCCTSGP